MNFLEIVGSIALFIICITVLYFIYSLLRALVLACDFVMWQYFTTKRYDPELKFSIFTFLRGVRKNWIDMIGYTSDSFTCELKGSTWNGFGSWRKK